MVSADIIYNVERCNTFVGVDWCQNKPEFVVVATGRVTGATYYDAICVEHIEEASELNRPLVVTKAVLTWPGQEPVLDLQSAVAAILGGSHDSEATSWA